MLLFMLLKAGGTHINPLVHAAIENRQRHRPATFFEGRHVEGAKSFSSHGQGHDILNDSPNCFASRNVNSGSLAQYWN
jgi:hypothetical protein